MSPALHARKWFVLAGLVLTFPGLLWSQTNGLLGGDVSLSGPLNSDQTFPSAAFGPNGGFFVWQDAITDPSGLGISAQRLSAAQVPEGEVIHVNQTLGRDQSRARVSMLNDGGAAVVYQSGKSGAQNVLARFLTVAGGFATGELLINNPAFAVTNRYTTNWTLVRNNRPRNQKYQIRELVRAREDFNANPVVATLNDGSVVVAYASSRVYTTNTHGLSETLRWDDRRSLFITNRVRVPLNIRVDALQDVYLQRLTAAGQKIGDETRVNQRVSFNQRDPALAALDNGNFVLVWVSEQQRFENSIDVYARIFDGLGNPLGHEFLVNTTNRPCGAPSVAKTSAGGFTIAWSERQRDRNSGLDILARTFDANGAAASPAFPVNTTTYGDQTAPSVASVGSQQVMVWMSMGQDGSFGGIYGRAFNGSTPLGNEFRVNVSTPFNQMHPGLASDSTGRTLVFWSGYALQSGFDIFGRWYMTP